MGMWGKSMTERVLSLPHHDSLSAVLLRLGALK